MKCQKCGGSKYQKRKLLLRDPFPTGGKETQLKRIKEHPLDDNHTEEGSIGFSESFPLCEC
jgi:hypothetical protein